MSYYTDPGETGLQNIAIELIEKIMANLNTATLEESVRGRELSSSFPEDPGANSSGVSWGAIFAGAAAAAALSLILLMLGVGLGLSAVSPWKQDGVSAATFGVTTILWITLTQLMASGMGGYLAGRLRTKWVSLKTDEVFFRDTAHGFLAWAVASLSTAALLTSVIGSIVSGGLQTGAAVAGAAASTAVAATAAGVSAAGSDKVKSDSDSDPMSYFVDLLFRKDPNATVTAVSPDAIAGATATGSAPITATSVPEVSRILMNTVRTGALAPDDVRYVGQLVAKRTGLTQQEAEKRVTETYARMQMKLRDGETAAREAADKSRKASSYAALWLFISLLIGAFIASLCATYGGRHRDA